MTRTFATFATLGAALALFCFGSGWAIGHYATTRSGAERQQTHTGHVRLKMLDARTCWDYTLTWTPTAERSTELVIGKAERALQQAAANVNTGFYDEAEITRNAILLLIPQLAGISHTPALNLERGAPC
jgi:hypothetical protein